MELDYKGLILSLAASATLADHMGDMWDDIREVLKRIGETELADADIEDLGEIFNRRGIKTVWGTEFESE